MRTLSVALLTLGDPGKLTGGYLYHRRMAEEAPNCGARIDFVSFPERPFPLAILDAAEVLRRAADLGANALVVDSIAAAFLGPSLVLRPPEIPLVAMLHQPPGGIDHGPVRTAMQSVLDRLAYRRARLLLVASDSLSGELAAMGVPRKKLRVVPPGRDLATAASPLPDLRLGRQTAFLCVGNWVERKGILWLLDALAPLPADAATLHLVGDERVDARYSKRVRTRLARPDLRGRVVVHGPLPREAVAAMYEAADLFVLPSSKEPYGTVYGEAMAASLPVVGWALGNLPYLADNNIEGILIPPGDVLGLSNALAKLAKDSALRRRLGAAGKERAGTRPTWAQSAALFFGAIREAVE
jgi:glycosyltransferase involved in cell wall biosynthesis